MQGGWRALLDLGVLPTRSLPEVGIEKCTPLETYGGERGSLIAPCVLSLDVLQLFNSAGPCAQGGTNAGIFVTMSDTPASPTQLRITGPPPYGADPELDAVSAWFKRQGDLREIFGDAIRQALDEIIDTARTGRWDLEQCNDQEKAYVGVKVEHVIRGTFELGYGTQARMDFDVDGIDVDCKWSKNFGQWQIPNEAVGHLCLLVWADEATNQMGVGLIRITEELLVGGNRDQKRSIQSPGGRSRIRWLVPPNAGVPPNPGLPPNFLLHLDPSDREAILSLRGGDARAQELFKRCEGIILHRHTIESIGQQKDEGRRFRGETRAALRAEGFEVLNGHWKDQKARARELGGPVPENSKQWVCLRSDGSTPARLSQKRATGGGP